MAKETKLSEFEKDEIIALRRVKRSQREISKAFGCSKTIICNSNKYETKKPNWRPEKLSPWFKRKFVREVKTKI